MTSKNKYRNASRILNNLYKLKQNMIRNLNQTRFFDVTRSDVDI